MKYTALWMLGALLNGALVSVPLLFFERGTEAFGDVRFLIMLVILTLWVGCDLCVGEKDISHYRDPGTHHVSQENFARVSAALALCQIWTIVAGLARAPGAAFAIVAGGAGAPVGPDAAGAIVFGVSAAVVVVGVIPALFGLLVRFLAIRALGSFFTTQLRVLTFQPLVTDGIYRRIRHPSYSGLLLIMLGLVVLTASGPGALYYIVIMVPLVIYRVNREEVALVEGFGQPYQEYRRLTWRLVPYVY